MDTESEITGAVSSFQNNTNFKMLRKRWNSDFDYFRLKPYNAGKGYYSYTSNTPRILADKTISILVDANLMIRIPEGTYTDKEKAIASDVERYLYGAINLNDEKVMYLPDTPTSRQLKAWYGTVRGSFAERIFVHKNDKSETDPDIKIWDMYNVAYGCDNNGIIWAANVYKISPQQAKDEYNISTGTGDVGVIDFWDDKKNVFIVNQTEVRRTSHDLGYCPVFIFRAGATPVIWQDTYQFTDKHSGESIFAANRELFPILNKTLSDLMTLVRRGVKVPLGIWSPGGKETIEEDIYQVEKAGIVPLDINTIVKPLLTPTMPADAKDLLAILVGELQRGGFPHTAYGELGFRLSGFAISQLQAALATVISPYICMLEQSYVVECLELLKQYAGKKLPPIKVRGRTSRNTPFGYPKAMLIKPSDVKGDWHPEIKLEAILPKDDAQRVELARLLREGEIPLLSDETIRSDTLGIKDPDLEDDKIDAEWADKQLINRMYDAYMRFVEAGDMIKAGNVLAALRFAMAQQSPGAGGGGRSPTRRMAAGTPGVGLPIGETGMSSETLPPESLGGMPPGAMNANLPPEGGI